MHAEHGRRLLRSRDRRQQARIAEIPPLTLLPIQLGSSLVPERAGPERLWLAEGGADLRGSFSTPTVLLCGGAHGAAWADAQGGRGELLNLAEGARRGGTDWAGCAEATKGLS